MKRFLSIITCIAILMCTKLIVFADNINVVVDNQTISFPDVQPTIINGRTLIPIRTLTENFGGEVFWDENSKVVTITKRDANGNIKLPDNNLHLSDITYTVNLKIDSPLIMSYISSPMLDKALSFEMNSDVVPIIIDGRTMLPARYVANLLGYEVSWNESTRTVSCIHTGVFDAGILNKTNDSFSKIKVYTNMIYTQQLTLDTLSEEGKTKITSVLSGDNTYLNEVVRFTLLVSFNSLKVNRNDATDNELKTFLINELDVPLEYQEYLRDFNYNTDKDLFAIFTKL